MVLWARKLRSATSKTQSDKIGPPSNIEEMLSRSPTEFKQMDLALGPGKRMLSPIPGNLSALIIAMSPPRYRLPFKALEANSFHNMSRCENGPHLGMSD